MEQNKIRVLKNGALFDTEKKRIVGLKPELAEKNVQITSQNAAEFVARRMERKREIISQAANEAVERDDYKMKYGGDAWIAAITEAQYIKATTPDDPKATDAARFLLQEAGISERQAIPQADAPQLAQLLGSVAAAAVEAAIRAGRMDNVIDVTPMRHDDEQGDG